MRVLGHRGASAVAPENTIEAFALAAAMGAHGVELDVRFDGGGRLVVHHDAELADGRLLVATAPQDVPGSIPTLAAALDACRGMTVNVEIKNIPGEPDFDRTTALVPAVADLLAARDDDVVISCFHLATVDRCLVAGARWTTAFLSFVDPGIEAAIDLAVAHGHAGIHPHVSVVTPGAVDRAHDLGLAVRVWTVDDPGRIVELAEWGVDAVVTNVPDVALAALSDG